MVHIPSCALCSGRRPFCIHKSYPLVGGWEIEKKIKEKLKKDFFGPSYSVFVGREGYPDVFAGPLVGIEEKEAIDSPQSWMGMEYSKIIELRSFLLRSKKMENIKSKSRFIRQVQELSLAHRPADIEVGFKKTPVYSFRLSEALQPMGPSGELEKMRVTENIKVKEKIERIVTDDLKAGQATFLLYKAGLDVYKIASIFSSGSLGLEKNKKLVPSRWTATGIDDIIAKALIEKIKKYPSINEYEVFESMHIDNHFVVLLMPGSWEFENFEVWAPGSNWALPTQSRIIEEYEPFQGRKEYAEKQAGGYYASRISAVSYLEKIKRQARVVVFREVGEDYSVPLGVWLVRETSGKAFAPTPKKFQTQQEALSYIKTRLRIPIEEYRKQSRILGQKRIFEF